MRRRTFLAASVTTLALPAITRAASQQVLKFVPQADLAVLDPILTTAGVTRSHGYLVFDTLYAVTGPEHGFKAMPQMAAGHRVEDDGRTWRVTLRDGLMFHDGQKVLARDCVASIRRWGARDTLGQALMARADEVSAPDDKTITFRLKRPFPLLPDALGKLTPNICAIMPERLASTDPYKQITEMVGSGPYRFKADERVQGSRFVYERFVGYQPREDGEPDWTAGPKVAHLDRIEWHIIPDAATAAAALQSGEVDWWELPTGDLLPVLRHGGKISVAIIDPTGNCAILRPNHLHPPFDNPAIRRALLVPSRSHCRVQPLQLHAGVSGGELPIGFDMFLVAGILPGGDFLGQGLLVGDTSIETLARQHAEFGLGHVQPTAVFGCVVPFEPLDEAARLGRGEGFVE